MKTSKITRVRIVVKLVETVDSWSTVFLSFNEIALTKFRAATKQKSRVWLNPIILDALCAEGSLEIVNLTRSRETWLGFFFHLGKGIGFIGSFLSLGHSPRLDPNLQDGFFSFLWTRARNETFVCEKLKNWEEERMFWKIKFSYDKQLSLHAFGNSIFFFSRATVEDSFITVSFNKMASRGEIK